MLYIKGCLKMARERARSWFLASLIQMGRFSVGLLRWFCESFYPHFFLLPRSSDPKLCSFLLTSHLMGGWLRGHIWHGSCSPLVTVPFTLAFLLPTLWFLPKMGCVLEPALWIGLTGRGGDGDVWSGSGVPVGQGCRHPRRRCCRSVAFHQVGWLGTIPVLKQNRKNVSCCRMHLRVSGDWTKLNPIIVV